MAKNKLRLAIENIQVPTSIVSYEAQSLSTAQQAQVASNISALQYNSQSLTTSQKTQARENIGAGNNDMIVVNDVSVAASAWASDSTYESYPYAANIAVTGCTANHYPQVTMELDDAISGNYAPVVQSNAGTVTIYAKTAPTSAITISTIVCTKVK